MEGKSTNFKHRKELDEDAQIERDNKYVPKISSLKVEYCYACGAPINVLTGECVCSD